MRDLELENRKLEDECHRTTEDLNMYKGKCANLSRDMEMTQKYMSKVSEENSASTDQFRIFKDRIRLLETDLENAIREKTDALYECKRL